MEIQVEESQKDKEMPMKNGNAGVIDSDSENAEENLDLNVEDVKKNKLVLEKNQDKIAEISHYLILKNVIIVLSSLYNKSMYRKSMPKMPLISLC